MANWLHDDGKLKPGSDNRPPKLEEPQWQLDGVQYHHLIPYNTLRAFWNALVDMVKPREGRYVKVGHHRHQMAQYLKIIGYEDHAVVLTTAIWKGKLKDVDPNVADTLAIMLCWQPYNIMIGPTSAARPVHAPDPGEFFEGIPPTECHRLRVWRLREANDWMIQYAATKRVTDFGRAMTQLEQVCDLPIIPMHDMNWSGVNQSRFNALSETQRLEFHYALRDAGRAADPEQVFSNLFDTHAF